MAQYEEQLIVEFLKLQPNAFFSPIEVCRKAGTRQLFLGNPRWAIPVLRRLLEKEYVDCTPEGHYRYLSPQELEERRRKERKRDQRPG